MPLKEKALKVILTNERAEREHEGLENTPKAFIGLFAGENLGKQLLKVS